MPQSRLLSTTRSRPTESSLAGTLADGGKENQNGELPVEMDHANRCDYRCHNETSWRGVAACVPP